MKKLTPPIRKDRKPLQDLLPLKQPLRVNIDPCDICNFKCDFCFQCKDTGFKGSIMTTDMFERVVDQLKEFAEPINVVHLYALGEPFINKNMPLFIRRLKEEGVAKEVKTTTNGSLLSPEMIDGILEAGLDDISISLNGLKDEDFKRIAAANVKFDQMYDNLKYLYERRGSCHVHIKIIGDYFSKEEQKYFIEKIGEHADTINIDGLTNHWSGLEMTQGGRQYNTMEETDQCTICALCFYELTIHSNGTVSPCSVDWQIQNETLGSIMDMTLKQIWNSKKRNDMLVSFLEGTINPYKACRECEYPNSGASVNLDPYREELRKKYV